MFKKNVFLLIFLVFVVMSGFAQMPYTDRGEGWPSNKFSNYALPGFANPGVSGHITWGEIATGDNDALSILVRTIKDPKTVFNTTKKFLEAKGFEGLFSMEGQDFTIIAKKNDKSYEYVVVWEYSPEKERNEIAFRKTKDE